MSFQLSANTWIILKIKGDYYLITKAQSHYSDEKAKESFKFPQTYTEIQTVSNGLCSVFRH